MKVKLLAVFVIAVVAAMAQLPLPLKSKQFIGGPGDQSARSLAVAPADGAVYLGGAEGGLIRVAVPPAGVAWNVQLQGGSHLGLMTSGSLLYSVGAALPPVCGATDGVGDTEPKGMVSLYAPSSGAFVDCRATNVFPYRGYESYRGIVAQGASLYAAGSAETCGFGNNMVTVTRFDSNGVLQQEVAEPGANFNGFSCTGASEGNGITTLNGSLYVVGHSKFEDGQYRPVLSKYSTDLVRQWKVRPTDNPGGVFQGVTTFGGAIYAVGYIGINTHTDFLIEKYDENGQQIWSKTSGGAQDDVLYAVVGVGSRIYAVGSTNSQGAGGTDAAILEIDPATGATISTTLFGGAGDEVAYAVGTDGTDLYVAGSSRSFASPEGNAVGQSDMMLLHYGIPALPNVTVSPVQGVNTAKASVTLSGSSILTSGATITLSAPGLPDIFGTVYGFGNSTLVVAFDLTGAATGVRNIVITSGGATYSMLSAFTVVGVSACTYSLAPASGSFPAIGGTATFIVSTTPAQCPWTPTSAASWITLNPVIRPMICTPAGCAGTPVVSITVAANPGLASRTGTVNVAGTIYTVTQAGASACNYAVSPSAVAFASSGGSATVNVTAGSGCSWSVQGLPSWLTVISGASGAGSASVVLGAGSNNGVQRSATLTIAGKSLPVSQAAVGGVPSCGALDVSGLVSVSRGPLQMGFLGNYYSQTVTVRNNSGQPIAGPVNLIMDGVPRSCQLPGRTQQTTCGPYPANLTHCGSSNGSAWVTVTGGGLSPGASATVTVTMYPGLAPASYFNYSSRVFSGNPNQ